MPPATVRFHRLAEQEYQRVCRAYARQRVGLDERFANEVDRVIQRISTDPQCGGLFRHQFRWVRLHRFPYLLYYAEIDVSNVLVLSVSHKRRRPGYWISRTSRQ